jgi:hypothetical protein
LCGIGNFSLSLIQKKLKKRGFSLKKEWKVFFCLFLTSFFRDEQLIWFSWASVSFSANTSRTGAVNLSENLKGFGWGLLPQTKPFHLARENFWCTLFFVRKSFPSVFLKANTKKKVT